MDSLSIFKKAKEDLQDAMVSFLTVYDSLPENKNKSNSKRGYDFENHYIQLLIAVGLAQRVATKHEQLTQGFDYIDRDGFKVDVKFQPRAYQFKTFNVELDEYGSGGSRKSWYYTSTADRYDWWVGDGTMLFIETQDLHHNVDDFLIPRNERTDEQWDRYDDLYYMGMKKVCGNGATAQAMSSSHGSAKYDNATTVRVPISLYK